MRRSTPCWLRTQRSGPLGLRTAWSLLFRRKLTEPHAYAELVRLDFTSRQVGNLLMSAQMRHAELLAVKKTELRQLELSILQREGAIADKRKKMATLEKHQAKLRPKRDAWAPKTGKERTKRYLQALRKLRDVDSELFLCRNWVKQKETVLRDKRGRVARLAKDLAAGPDSRRAQAGHWHHGCAVCAAC